jgi:hypothetical protein
MTNIKTNYDIYYEKNKNKIIFNIYSDVINEESIPIKNDNVDNNNNNDTLTFISNIFVFLESNIYSLYKYLINNLPKYHRAFYKLQFIFFIINLLFAFVYSFEENSNISTHLIVSAYFPNCQHLTYVKYEKVIDFHLKKNEKKTTKFIKKAINNTNTNEKEKILDCQNRYISDDLKSLMSSSANPKNTYVNYEKKNYNNKILNKDEFYLFFIIPIKSCLFSIVSLILLYYFIKITYTSKIRGSFLFNIFSMFIIYNITNGLYESSYFLASTFMFILLVYLFKSLIDSIYLLLKYRKKDFEIFSTNLTAVNCHQFLLKLIILSLATIISGFMSISIYKLCLNYIIFYLCLLTLMVFLCNCLEPFSPAYLKPIKNILMFLVGLVNFIICKLYFSNNTTSAFDINSGDMLLIEKDEEDNIIYESSLYLVSDLFSLFCFDYLREYIDYRFEDFKIQKKLTKLDLIIILFFASSFCIGIIGIIKNEYICFILAIYIAKISMGYFIKKFNTKISRLINHLIVIYFIFLHLKISSKRDNFLINFFSFTKINNRILSNIFEMSNLFILVYYCCDIYYEIYYSTESLNNDELKELPEEQVNKILEFTSNISKQKLKNLKIQIIHDNKKYKMSNIFYMSNDICLFHFEICIIFVILNNYENSYIKKLLYNFLILLFNAMKFFVVNKIQNNVEYLSIVFISFIFTLRLLLLSFTTIKIWCFLCQMNILVLIICYSLNDKKNKFISIIIVFHLIFELSKINTFYLVLDIISLVFSPMFKDYYFSKKDNNDLQLVKNGEKQKKINLSFLFFLFLLFMFSLQLYGFQNFSNILNNFIINVRGNEKIITVDLKDNKDKAKNRMYIEYYIINEIYSFLLNNN